MYIGISPLHIACREGMTKFVKWMLLPKNRKKCNINIYDPQCKINYPPIICAIKAGNFECVHAICRAYKNTVEIVEHNGLIHATECGNIRILQLLLSTLIKRKGLITADMTQLVKKCKFLQVDSLNMLIGKAKESESLGMLTLSLLFTCDINFV